MLKAALDWLGFGAAGHGHVAHGHGHDHGHGHGGDEGHGHTHGVIDPSIATTERGIWAIKWSFIGLAITAVVQMFVVWLSGSVALLADTIHNVGDAATAIPLYVAFWFARRRPTEKFTYGYGRVEDLAGVIVVALILFSAIVAGYQAIDRLINPQEIGFLAAVAAAGVIGFLGNEAVAVFRIRVGREIQSAALIADGYHARVDGLTSLAVVLGAIGVWLGFPLADPLVGLIITVMIFGIVWQSTKAVFSRMLDGVEPEVLAELRHAAEHIEGVAGLDNVRARWVGHRLHAEADLIVDPSMAVRDGAAIAARVREAAMRHLPALSALRLAYAEAGPNPQETGARESGHDHGDHHGHDHGDGHVHSHDFFI
ncbi:MAG: cation diffusion facilitator family transporter [Gammaproteobacteria bacterium]|nr:cation diffusion facilitator family transporter [Gammaproteobacteria bacterium]